MARTGGDADARPGLHPPLGDDPQVEAGAVVADQQRGHLRLTQPQADPVAGDPRLSDLELGLADAVAVADADLVVGQPVDGEVLAEVAVAEVVPAEVLLPVPVRVELVDQHRALLAAAPGQVALAVAVDVEAADHGRAVHWLLPHPGVDRLALPVHVLGQADVHRHQRRRGQRGLVHVLARHVPAGREARLEQHPRPGGVGHDLVAVPGHQAAAGLADVDAVAGIGGMPDDPVVRLVELVHGSPR
jgi:hypothetical protein